MTKPRQSFYKNASDFLEWCTDEELRVLGIKVSKTLESRLESLTRAFEPKLPNVKAKRLRG